jgi:steroid 5-alpha reductase family enzyme
LHHVRPRVATPSTASRVGYAAHVSTESAPLGRTGSLVRIGWIYAAALAVCAVVFSWIRAHPLLVVLAGMLAATAVTYVATLVWRNGSVFDAYWSVVPPLVALHLTDLGRSFGTPLTTAVLLVVFAWAVRLTLNWAVSWPGLHHEDWRYAMLYERAPMPRWLVQLLAVDLVPTVVIFLGCIPLWPALTRGDGELGGIGWLAAAVGLLATALELAADEQRRAHAEASPGTLVDMGLWRWSRHPNYLGEILFWVSLWLFAIAADPGVWWWTAIGPVAIVTLFLGASIPVMDERSAGRRPGWADYAARTPALWPRRPRRVE